MVTSNIRGARRIRVIAVEVPVNQDDIRFASRPRSRDLLPWADPYIAKLIHNLQDEVREERAAARAEAIEIRNAQATFTGEAPPPLVVTPVEADPSHDHLWPPLTEWDD